MIKIVLVILVFLVACTDQVKSTKSSGVMFEKSRWESNIIDRASMLDDFLLRYNITDYNRLSLEEILGDSDGYYLYDEFPAYRLKEIGDCVVAFPIDRNTGNIKEVVISPIGCMNKAAN